MENFIPPSAAGALIPQYSGNSRWAYEYLFDPEWMIKVYNPDRIVFERVGIKSNQFELDTYQHFQTLGLAQWLAPCKMQDGLFLMKRPSPLPSGTYHVPKFLTNRLDYWGILDGQPVTTNYPYEIFVENEKLYGYVPRMTGIPDRYSDLDINKKIKYKQIKTALDQNFINLLSSEFQTLIVS